MFWVWAAGFQKALQGSVKSLQLKVPLTLWPPSGRLISHQMKHLPWQQVSRYVYRSASHHISTVLFKNVIFTLRTSSVVAIPGAMVTAVPSVAPVQCAHFVNDLLQDHTEWLHDKGLNVYLFSELRFDIFNFQREGSFGGMATTMCLRWESLENSSGLYEPLFSLFMITQVQDKGPLSLTGISCIAVSLIKHYINSNYTHDSKGRKSQICSGVLQMGCLWEQNLLQNSSVAMIIRNYIPVILLRTIYQNGCEQCMFKSGFQTWHCPYLLLWPWALHVPSLTDFLICQRPQSIK